ncbi:methyltransferase domain-containing protein [Kribbella sancticallisti]|uniref:Methyltransferase domain-containing protein n=1 Tax=Kribbella sancticallisti TaxID=460087 RepID=A0ABP4QIM8_9ACTN
MQTLSPRLAAVVDALPLSPGLRVLEFGCGPGAATREVARRVGPAGFVLGVDRSAKAIEQALAQEQSSPGTLAFRRSTIEAFELEPGEQPYDLAFAIRVGALDGRHPDLEQQALARIAAALTPTGQLFIDGGNPLRELDLTR